MGSLVLFQSIEFLGKLVVAGCVEFCGVPGMGLLSQGRHAALWPHSLPRSPSTMWPLTVGRLEGLQGTRAPLLSPLWGSADQSLTMGRGDGLPSREDACLRQRLRNRRLPQSNTCQLPVPKHGPLLGKGKRHGARRGHPRGCECSVGGRWITLTSRTKFIHIRDAEVMRLRRVVWRGSGDV